ncbi:extensin family protein [Qipengyuania sp.]|uniref:extensin-like domain-containing protein n=1 Tax=Qipengyuania sp. TaxID=2004515 RepID=UPI0035C857D3
MRINALAICTAVSALTLAGCSALPARKTSAPPRSSGAVTQPVIASQPETRQCLAELGASGARFGPLEDRYYAPGCQAVGSVRLEAIRGDEGRFDLTNLGPVACPLANAFAGWARYGVDRAARQILGAGLARIQTMGSYSCRNVAGTGRLSAHSRAEAIDIGGFLLSDGRVITVEKAWNGTASERQFFRIIHASACKRFGTVLGPDYNAAHHNHLHVELGRGSFCR